MKYIDLINRLGKWVKVVQKSIIILAIVEAIIVLIIGVASNNLSDNNAPTFWLYLLISLGILFIVITVIKIAYNRSFPSSIIEELKAKKKLEESKKLIRRKDAINDYISNTIIALSKCECNIPKVQEGNWEVLSDRDFTVGITELTATFNSVLNILLNTTNVKFTTGIYINNFRAINENNYPERNGGTYFLRDDFGFSEAGDKKNLMHENGIQGFALEIQNGLKVSINNGKFYKKDIEENGKIVTQICSNIQNLKKVDQQNGVLFIISHQLTSLPKDIEAVFRMFTNIISHWLDLYHHEVTKKQMDSFSSNDEYE